MAEQRPQVVSSQSIFEGRVFSVHTDIVTQNGKPCRFDIVEHPNSYAIIARPTINEVLLVRQYRHATDAYLWELPAGSSEKGEDAIDGVRRELREETGYSAQTVREIFATYMSPGFCTELMRYFVADGLTSGETQFDEDEDIETQTFAIGHALEMIHRSEILDAKTAVGLLYFERFLKT